jgi:alpha-D-ribose 1-methylphosphonate 5-triphosphate synthase subunit PhnL
MTTNRNALLRIDGLGKRFTLHQQQGATLHVLEAVSLELRAGECLVLDGASGQGKSTLLKLVYGNYRASCGSMLLYPGSANEIELTAATPRQLIAVRRDAIGYVSQFLRVIPRVPALDVVAEPLLEGCEGEAARTAARAEAARWLQRLRIPEKLWQLPPATFSGGEQQRVNIARSMIRPRPILLLDEPTASLDAANTATVVELVAEARQRGAAILGVFHDPDIAAAVATRRIPIDRFHAAAARADAALS